jgi:ACR3 family arsenite efflux pump ArsB
VALGGRLGFFKETYNLEMYFDGIGERAIRVDEGKKLHLKLGFILMFSLVTLIGLLTMIILLFANNVTNNGSVYIIIFIPITIIVSVSVCVFIGCCVHVEHNKTKYLHDHGERVIGTVTRK